jgi:hypothetical protein
LLHAEKLAGELDSGGVVVTAEGGDIRHGSASLREYYLYQVQRVFLRSLASLEAGQHP